MSTQLKKGVLDLVVLSKIEEKDRYGYDIFQEISKHMVISESTIYPILRKMVKEGFLDTYLKASNEGPPRKYFTITIHGKKRYKALCDEWENFKNSIEELLGGVKNET